MSETTNLTNFPNGVGQLTGLATGGAAGTLTVVGGLKSDDRLLQAFQVAVGTSGTVTTVADLTSEFSVVGDDKIDNTSGTATTGDLVMITFALSPRE